MPTHQESLREGQSNGSGRNINFTEETTKVSPLVLARRYASRALINHPLLNLNESTTVIDFGCGTGALSHAIAAYAGSIIGIDVSTSKIEKYNQTATDQGLDPSEMKGIVCDILTENFYFKADIVVSAMTFHHLPDMRSTVSALTRALLPNGLIAVVDLQYDERISAVFANAKKLKKEINHASNCACVVHHVGGIKPAELEDAFERAGFVDIDLQQAAFTVKTLIPERLARESGLQKDDLLNNSTSTVWIELPFLVAVARKP
ncbi:S-adenosyl-L-methionine-dependent methyltransferase [Lipomyces japonicus]|uniref:S-adenosyl-L-methionine-dependent methyltransferase n=1 Tax=Lipomyces japonicus TaxID=56871 RepID=UPI0034CF408F